MVSTRTENQVYFLQALEYEKNRRSELRLIIKDLPEEIQENISKYHHGFKMNKVHQNITAQVFFKSIITHPAHIRQSDRNRSIYNVYPFFMEIFEIDRIIDHGEFMMEQYDDPLGGALTPRFLDYTFIDFLFNYFFNNTTRVSRAQLFMINTIHELFLTHNTLLIGKMLDDIANRFRVFYHILSIYPVDQRESYDTLIFINHTDDEESVDIFIDEDKFRLLMDITYDVLTEYRINQVKRTLFF